MESREHGSATNLDFLDCIAHHSGGGSGPSYLSGWITVYSFFDEEGKGVAASNHWPVIDTDTLNHNVASYPVKIEDNGVTYKSRLFVGQMGYEAVTVSDESVTNVTSLGIVKQGGGPLMSLTPRNDWALVVYKRTTKEAAHAQLSSSHHSHQPLKLRIQVTPTKNTTQTPYIQVTPVKNTSILDTVHTATQCIA